MGRELVSGDIITICTTSLVFHANRRAQPTREIRTIDVFRMRVEEEIERGRHYQRPLALAAAALGLGVADRLAIARVLMEHVRLIIRIVAATNRDLASEVKTGGFRQDLFYRLSGATVWLPPLRDRQRELPILAQLFLEETCARLGRPSMALADDAVRALAGYEWPGNVRELKNVLDFAAATHNDALIEARHLMPKLWAQNAQGSDQTSPGMLALNDWPLGREAKTPDADDPLAEAKTPVPASFRPIEEEMRDLEKRRMAEALEATDGVQTRAAKLIGMPLRTFQSKVKQHGLRKNTRPTKRS